MFLFGSYSGYLLLWKILYSILIENSLCLIDVIDEPAIYN
jgi:hypothetical protein